jgi:hypothetical protein
VILGAGAEHRFGMDVEGPMNTKALKKMMARTSSRSA